MLSRGTKNAISKAELESWSSAAGSQIKTPPGPDFSFYLVGAPFWISKVGGERANKPKLHAKLSPLPAKSKAACGDKGLKARRQPYGCGPALPPERALRRFARANEVQAPARTARNCRAIPGKASQNGSPNRRSCGPFPAGPNACLAGIWRSK